MILPEVDMWICRIYAILLCIPDAPPFSCRIAISVQWIFFGNSLSNSRPENLLTKFHCNCACTKTFVVQITRRKQNRYHFPRFCFSVKRKSTWPLRYLFTIATVHFIQNGTFPCWNDGAADKRFLDNIAIHYQFGAYHRRSRQKMKTRQIKGNDLCRSVLRDGFGRG